ncbi:T3SS effector HopA1 family protein [Kineococcus arenarius]|uniref:T3SS effector HopA1 family protein n=1 Tax=unclassified Kineococcus TaxID=2621656 RepID=UPI003D7CE81D
MLENSAVDPLAMAPDVILQGVLDGVHITADASRATVLDRKVAADSPREMKRLLAAALYEGIHAGMHVGETPPRLRDADLEAQLVAAVPVRTVRVRLPVLSPPQTAPGSDSRHVLVGLAGVRVWVPEADVHPASATDGAGVPTVSGTSAPGTSVPGTSVPGIADVVLPAVRPAVSPGFLFVDRCPAQGGQIQRVYVNVIGSDHAPAVWGAVLEHLENAEVPFRAKVLSAKDLYPRRDAVVVYLQQQYAAAARTLVGAIAGLNGVGADVSRFAAQIGPGVAMAAEPRDDRQGMQGLSFGEHRATVLATALVESAATPHERPARARAALLEAGIDPFDLSRNLPGPTP